MSAPVKPWEKSKTPGDLLVTGRSADETRMNGNSMNNMGLFSNLPMPSAPAGPLGLQRRNSRTRPPPPPALGAVRGNQGYLSAPNSGNTYASMMGGFNGYGGAGNSYGGYGTGGYSGFGTSGYGGYGGYGASGYGGTMGSYGGYSRYGGMGGYGMNRFNQQPMNNLENRFIQMAEESSRPAFDSIESLVQTFGSVSFMMESTFGALYSSFRAVLGVAENFGRLRTLFGQVFSTFAVLRFFQWAYRKLLYYLGLRSDNPAREAIWQQAAGPGFPDPVAGEARRTMWPVALFLAIVCSGPYLMWKLLSSINVPPVTPPVPAGSAQAIKTWIASKKPMYMGLVQYDFEARTEQEMSVRANQQLYIAPNDFQTGGRDWVMAGSKSSSGFIPRDYVAIRGPIKLQQKASQIPAANDASTSGQQPLSEPVISEPVLTPAAVVAPNNTHFPQLEQFDHPSPPAFQPGEFEPNIGSSDEKIPGVELP